MIEALRELRLLATGEAARTFPLSGGVSSDVFGVRGAGGRAFVVKRSIPRLRVAADWRAPVERDANEVNWLRTVRGLDADLAPEVIAWSPERHLFVMPWLGDFPAWKAEMAAGRVDPGFAGAVGEALARIHAATAGRGEIAVRFPDDRCFEALRIDPFLRFTAGKHPDVAARLEALAADLKRRRDVLVWGDASPKNILVGPDGPVFLDAETATIGDGAFDLAFCLTHLLLKTVWLAPRAGALMASYAALRDAYGPGEDLSRRAAALIGALLLARVDGKSPAGYLDPAQDHIIRHRAKAILARPDLNLTTLPGFWDELAAHA
jgi:aminoglycoside phosphotransferase (APT) family kinase protein